MFHVPYYLEEQDEDSALPPPGTPPTPLTNAGMRFEYHSAASRVSLDVQNDFEVPLERQLARAVLGLEERLARLEYGEPLHRPKGLELMNYRPLGPGMQHELQSAQVAEWAVFHSMQVAGRGCGRGAAAGSGPRQTPTRAQRQTHTPDQGAAAGTRRRDSGDSGGGARARGPPACSQGAQPAAAPRDPSEEPVPQRADADGARRAPTPPLHPTAPPTQMQPHAPCSGGEHRAPLRSPPCPAPRARPAPRTPGASGPAAAPSPAGGSLLAHGRGIAIAELPAPGTEESAFGGWCEETIAADGCVLEIIAADRAVCAADCGWQGPSAAWTARGRGGAAGAAREPSGPAAAAAAELLSFLTPEEARSVLMQPPPEELSRQARAEGRRRRREERLGLPAVSPRAAWRDGVVSACVQELWREAVVPALARLVPPQGVSAGEQGSGLSSRATTATTQDEAATCDLSLSQSSMGGRTSQQHQLAAGAAGAAGVAPGPQQQQQQQQQQGVPQRRPHTAGPVASSPHEWTAAACQPAPAPAPPPPHPPPPPPGKPADDPRPAQGGSFQAQQQPPPPPHSPPPPPARQQVTPLPAPAPASPPLPPSQQDGPAPPARRRGDPSPRSCPCPSPPQPQHASQLQLGAGAAAQGQGRAPSHCSERDATSNEQLEDISPRSPGSVAVEASPRERESAEEFAAAVLSDRRARRDRPGSGGAAAVPLLQTHRCRQGQQQQQEETAALADAAPPGRRPKAQCDRRGKARGRRGKGRRRKPARLDECILETGRVLDDGLSPYRGQSPVEQRRECGRGQAEYRPQPGRGKQGQQYTITPQKQAFAADSAGLTTDHFYASSPAPAGSPLQGRHPGDARPGCAADRPWPSVAQAAHYVAQSLVRLQQSPPTDPAALCEPPWAPALAATGSQPEAGGDGARALGTPPGLPALPLLPMYASPRIPPQQIGPGDPDRCAPNPHARGSPVSSVVCASPTQLPDSMWPGSSSMNPPAYETLYSDWGGPAGDRMPTGRQSAASSTHSVASSQLSGNVAGAARQHGGVLALPCSVAVNTGHNRFTPREALHLPTILGGVPSAVGHNRFDWPARAQTAVPSHTRGRLLLAAQFSHAPTFHMSPAKQTQQRHQGNAPQAAGAPGGLPCPSGPPQAAGPSPTPCASLSQESVPPQQRRSSRQGCGIAPARSAARSSAARVAEQQS